MERPTTKFTFMPNTLCRNIKVKSKIGAENSDGGGDEDINWVGGVRGVAIGLIGVPAWDIQNGNYDEHGKPDCKPLGDVFT